MTLELISLYGAIDDIEMPIRPQPAAWVYFRERTQEPPADRLYACACCLAQPPPRLPPKNG